MEFYDKTHRNFWCSLEFSAKEIRELIPPVTVPTYRYRRYRFEQFPKTQSLLRMDIYQWARQHFGPEYYESTLAERYYTEEEYQANLDQVPPGNDVKVTDHRWCITPSGIAFRHREDAVLFKLVWGGS